MMIGLFNVCVQLFTYIQYYYHLFLKDYFMPLYVNFIGELPEKTLVERVQCIQNGEVVGNVCGMDVDNVNLYDFIVYQQGIDRKTYKHRPAVYVCETSDVRFLSMEIEINATKLPIRLYEPDKYNYYVVDNIIDVGVIQYIVSTHYKAEYMRAFNSDSRTLNDIPFEIHIIDNDVNMVTIPHDKSIRIEKTIYSIV